MSADFWAGYISGAIGIIVGNPLDLIKVRLQAAHSTPASISITTTTPPSALTLASQFSSASSLIRGASAPTLGYGALNALLFVTYNRTSQFLTRAQPSHSSTPDLTTTFLAGAIGGLATWVVSTPTELIKCRAQLSSPSAPTNSLTITRQIMRTEGIRGLYFGGVITALRDSIGYGFYFWSYELSTRYMASRLQSTSSNHEVASSQVEEAAKVLLCGGLAGVVTWLSIFPLDVIKTRVQMQTPPFLNTEQHALLSEPTRRLGAIEIARTAYRNEGAGVFFRGLAVCSVRAFFVNAVQWAVYEWIMRELNPVAHQRTSGEA